MNITVNKYNNIPRYKFVYNASLSQYWAPIEFNYISLRLEDVFLLLSEDRIESTAENIDYTQEADYERAYMKE